MKAKKVRKIARQVIKEEMIRWQYEFAVALTEAPPEPVHPVDVTSAITKSTPQADA